MNLSGVAHAESILQFKALSGDFLGITSVTPFDPTLGTLDSVRVSIQGLVTIAGTTGQNEVITPVGPLPVPYSFQLNITQQFFGLAGKYFNFTDPATIQNIQSATGVGEPFVIQTPISYAFEFTAFSDLIGYVLPTVSAEIVPPLSGITGTRSAFEQTIVPIDEIDFVQQTSGLPEAG